MLDHAAEPQSLPLANLFHDDLNPRREVDPEGAAALADSIRAIGLIQPLAGRRVGDRVGIVVGGRRLTALQSLGTAAPPLVPVVLAPDDATAEAWATADPVSHRPLHPADEIRAFGRMARSLPVPAIAAAFAVTESHVRRRLALAGLPEPVLDALKAGEIGLSAAAVLTTAPTETQALDALAAGRGRDFGEHWWRRTLHPGGVQANDSRARFVGVDAYVAAGGTVTQDLFQDGAVFHDEPLLDRVFARCLRDAGAAIRTAEGWGWVAAVNGSWSEPAGKVKAPPKKAALPAGDADRLNALAEAARLTPAERAELADLEARWWAGAYPQKARARLGLAIYVDRAGSLCRHPHAYADPKAARARPGDDAEEGGEGDGGDDGRDNGGEDDTDAAVTVANPNPAAEAALSQALRDELRAIRHLALQTALLDRHQMLIDLLTWSVAGPLATYHRPLAVTLDHQPAPPQGEDGAHVDPRLVPPERGRAEPSPQDFAAFCARPAADRTALLDAALARALGAVHGPFADWLWEDLAAAPRRLWTPTLANFFGRLRTPALDGIWAQLFAGVDPDKDAAWARLKTRDKQAELAALFTSADHREAWGMSRDLAARVDAWMPEAV